MEAQEVKRQSSPVQCACTDLYENQMVKYLLGDSFHPGGLALTEILAEKLALTPEDHLLDLACGEGTTPLFLAESPGCRVTGLEMSQKNLEAAREKAMKAGRRKRLTDGKVTFVEGDALSLPFPDGIFQAVLSECAFSTFPDKDGVAREMVRVLSPGGRLGLSDVTIRKEELPEKMREIIYQAACIADARSQAEYGKIFEEAGLKVMEVEDQPWAMDDLLKSVEKKLAVCEIGMSLGLGKVMKIPGDLLQEAKGLVKEFRDLFNQGVIGYFTLIGKKV